MSLIKSIFQNNSPDLIFNDVSPENIVYQHYPPILAKNVKPFIKNTQEQNHDKYNFPGCPGMHDYSRIGYIIPAWSDFHIKANKAGSFAMLGSRGSSENAKRSTPLPQPRQMDVHITEGLFKIEDGIKPAVWNFPGAWSCRSSKNASALLLPAMFHSDFLDDLYVYPGVVDYSGFCTLNFICSPKRACEVHIKSGDPLLHVIPFISTRDFIAEYGPSSKEHEDYRKLLKWFHLPNFYRRFYMIKKKFKLNKRTYN
jgi:hypothetical protein